MEYWLYNFISEFWSLMQRQKQRVSQNLKTYFWVKECMIISTPNSYSIWVFFFFPWKRFFIPLKTMFQCANVASIGSAISFRSFDVSHRRRWGVYDYFNTQFLLNLGVLFFPWQRFFIPLKTIFQCANVASIGLAMSFRVFDLSLSRRWGSVSLFQHPILTQFWCSFFPLKVMSYTF